MASNLQVLSRQIFVMAMAYSWICSRFILRNTRPYTKNPSNFLMLMVIINLSNVAHINKQHTMQGGTNGPSSGNTGKSRNRCMMVNCPPYPPPPLSEPIILQNHPFGEITFFFWPFLLWNHRNFPLHFTGNFFTNSPSRRNF